jgi:hypothetical protein
MTGDRTVPGIYLAVQFNWPDEFKPGFGEAAKSLHRAVVASEWIEETVAASGGIGAGPSSMWIFKLENYGSLDRLLHDRDDPVSEAYVKFFSLMRDVEEIIREEVSFT